MAVQSRRDQVLAYRFLLRRRHAGLLAGDPDSPEMPLRKLATAGFASLMIATLMGAGAGVMGLIKPRDSTAWRDGRTVVVERETSSRFLYDTANGLLRPVLNYASARLLLAQSGWKTTTVSAAALRGTPRGKPVGIEGAPDELPPASGLAGAPWTVCSLPKPDAAEAGGRPRTLVAVGPDTEGRIPPLTAPDPSSPLLVKAFGDGTLWLIWRDRRYQIGDQGAPPGDPAQPAAVLGALGLAARRPVEVAPAWLDAVAEGPRLAPPAVTESGTADYTVGGIRPAIGQLLHVPARGTTGEQYYLAERRALRALTPLQADLLLKSGNPPTPRDITVADAAAPPKTQDIPGGVWMPDTSPQQLVNDSADLSSLTVCASYGDTTGEQSVPAVRLGSAAPSQLIATGTDQAPKSAAGLPLADAVALASGRAALVSRMTTDGHLGLTYLVTTYEGYGIAYPLTDPAAAAALGYGGVTPTPVPGALIDLLHAGPALSAADATTEHTPAAAPQPSTP